jgi:hypothetical protein
MEERPLPKLSWKLKTTIVLVFSAFTGVVEWLALRLDYSLPRNLLMGLPFVVACGVMLCAFRRCPSCRRRLRTRRKTLGDEWDTRFRVVYDCEQCQIAWNSDMIGDSKYDDVPT